MVKTVDEMRWFSPVIDGYVTAAVVLLLVEDGLLTLSSYESVRMSLAPYNRYSVSGDGILTTEYP